MRVTTEPIPASLQVFLRGQQDPATFAHADHVRVAFEMLRRHSFLSTARIYSRRLKQMTARIGRPTLYNETITIAFLALIAERVAAGSYASFEAFAAENPEVMRKSVLNKWYANERLNSDIARTTFILPEPAHKN